MSVRADPHTEGFGLPPTSAPQQKSARVSQKSPAEGVLAVFLAARGRAAGGVGAGPLYGGLARG